MPTKAQRGVFDYFQYYIDTGNACGLWSVVVTAAHVHTTDGLLGTSDQA